MVARVVDGVAANGAEGELTGRDHGCQSLAHRTGTHRMDSQRDGRSQQRLQGNQAATGPTSGADPGTSAWGCDPRDTPAD